MNTFLSFAIEIGITVAAAALITGYLRPHLKQILIELCRTETRAQFWMVFSNILLIGMPLIIALGFRPEAQTFEETFFEIIGRLSGNLLGFLFALIGLGFVISFFALVAPKPKAEAK